MLQTTSVRTNEFTENALSVASFLREIETQLVEHAARHGADLAIERAPSDLRAIANQSALHQIILNLVDTVARQSVAGAGVRIWCESNTHIVALRLRGGDSAAADGRPHDHAIITATRDVARSMGGDVKVSDGNYTIELRRTA